MKILYYNRDFIIERKILIQSNSRISYEYLKQKIAFPIKVSWQGKLNKIIVYY